MVVTNERDQCFFGTSYGGTYILYVDVPVAVRFRYTVHRHTSSMRRPAPVRPSPPRPSPAAAPLEFRRIRRRWIIYYGAEEGGKKIMRRRTMSPEDHTHTP